MSTCFNQILHCLLLELENYTTFITKHKHFFGKKKLMFLLFIHKVGINYSCPDSISVS